MVVIKTPCGIQGKKNVGFEADKFGDSKPWYMKPDLSGLQFSILKMDHLTEVAMSLLCTQKSCKKLVISLSPPIPG